MIKVTHLKKTYIDKNKVKSRGLEDVSFSLPNKGFVFVLGKSGCGKSTLLNLLGLLDDKTSGKIYIDNKDVDEFSEHEKSYYRSSYCGFIFQDYQLINELTVKENISLVLEIKDDLKDYEERIDSILSLVGLSSLKNKYPFELSGGEKQRVSIARALIKNPKVIFADEPTGNLDKMTSKVILEILKNISKNCLVFMVSHDESAALKYADRIITLEEGKVIGDKQKRNDYVNKLTIIDNRIYLPFARSLNNEEEKIINDNIASNELIFDQLDDGFIKNKEPIIEENNFSYQHIKFNTKAKNKLRNTYLKTDKLSSICNTLIFSLFTVLLILIQTFLSFSSADFYLNAIRDEQECVLISSINDYTIEGTSAFISLRENDKDVIFNNYSGNKYPVYNITPYFANVGVPDRFEQGSAIRTELIFNENKIYLGYTNGLAIVDEDYLLSRFQNEDGEIEVLAGSLSNCKDSLSIIITDFLADSIFDCRKQYGNRDYNSLIGDLRQYLADTNEYMPTINCNIGCIIKTNYREKYKQLFDTYDELIKQGMPINEYNSLLKSELYNNYQSDVCCGDLSLVFSLNQNYFSQYSDNLLSVRQFVRTGDVFYSTDDTFDKSDIFVAVSHAKVDNSINDYEIRLGSQESSYLRNLFQAQDIINKQFTIFKIDGFTYDGDYSSSINLKIVSCDAEFNLVNEFTFKQLMKMQTFVYAYLLPNNIESNVAIENAVNNNYAILDLNRDSYRIANKSLYLFGDIFVVLEIVVIVILVAYFAIYSIKSIKNKNYQIGIFKSLGMRNKDIFSVFVFKNLLFVVASLILTSILSYPFFALANKLLTISFQNFTKVSYFSIEVFYFHFDVFGFIYLGILCLFFIFTFIPLLMTKFITPAKIVNNKEDLK